VELPFGGVKSSGYGREKGFEALLGFTELKTVAIQHGWRARMRGISFLTMLPARRGSSGTINPHV
jgi:hypothetical protein